LAVTVTAPLASVPEADVGLLLGSLAPLGSPTAWKSPAGYPESLALCLLDSMWSLGSNYDRHVVPVLNRYRALRGSDVANDAASDLVAAVEGCGGPDGFAGEMRNRQLTSTRGGVLKAEAVYRAAKLMAQAGIETPSQLRSDADRVAMSWRKLPGQRSSATGWRYLLLLAGASEAKPDRMILRFVSHSLGRPCTPDDAHALLTAAAAHLDVPLPALDHRIWLFQSGRLSETPKEV